MSSITTVSDSVTVQDVGYSYDAVGNVTGIDEVADGGSERYVTYAYDDLDRLASAVALDDQSAEIYEETYAYDGLGNVSGRTVQIDSGTTAEYTYSYGGDAGTSYANPHAVTEITYDNDDVRELTYDENGNVLTDQVEDGYGTPYADTVREYSWDWGSRLAQSAFDAGTTAYGYDASGRRVSADDGLADVRTPTGLWTETRDSATGVRTGITKRLYANGRLIEESDNTGGSAARHFVHADHLGGTSVVTGLDGGIEQALDYYPYGEVRVDEQSGTFDERIKYAGHENDSGTGLIYMGARYYDPTLARFLSEDPLSRQNTETPLANPQLMNMYSYAANSPLRYNDPTGEGPVDTAGGYSYGLFEGLVAYGNACMDTLQHPIAAAGNVIASFRTTGQFIREFAADPSRVSSEISSGLSVMAGEYDAMSDFDRGRAVGPAGEGIRQRSKPWPPRI
ncbi:MAG: RHS repeat-associated core domain-containing protein [Patescibacteria group bacterium]